MVFGEAVEVSIAVTLRCVASTGEPADVAATRAFARHAVQFADQQQRSREILERRMAEKPGFKKPRKG